MAEAMSGPAALCPWCSAPLPDAAVERCPNCGAALAASGAEGEIKGVTTLDTEAILRARSDVARPRSRILSFITGEIVPETGGPASPESLAPPPDEVRREMLRLQLEAERADLAAETVAIKSDELLHLGIPLSELGVDESALTQPAGVAPEPAEAAPQVADAESGVVEAAREPAPAEPAPEQAADATAAVPEPETTEEPPAPA